MVNLRNLTLPQVSVPGALKRTLRPAVGAALRVRCLWAPLLRHSNECKLLVVPVCGGVVWKLLPKTLSESGLAHLSPTTGVRKFVRLNLFRLGK